MRAPGRRVRLAAADGGWLHPWPNVFEVAGVMPGRGWTLVGGLMVQAHALAHDVAVVRPTDDLDLLLDIEVSRSVASDTHRQISSLGYVLQSPLDSRSKTSPHYRYLRESTLGVERIDVMVADHAGPSAGRLLQGRPMFAVEGGTQALRRTMTCAIDDGKGRIHELTVPDELGAVVLKGAAYAVDRRDRERHLQDAAVLAACITDHAAELNRLAGSDRKRLRTLAKALADPAHPAWLALDPEQRQAGMDTLRILTDPT